MLCQIYLRFDSKLKACSSCSYVYYCSKKCQKLAWNRHKLECPHLKNIKEERKDFVRLIGQVLLLLKDNDWTSFSESVGNVERKFAELISNCEFTKNDPKLSLHGLEVMRLLKEYLGADNVPDDDEILEVIGKVKHNRFGVSGKGSALYIGASLFDHSCIPNAVRCFNGTVMTVRAMTSIKASDMRKVTLAYAPMVEAVDNLTETIKGFPCPCYCIDCSRPYGDSKLTKILDKTRAWSVIELTEDALIKLEKSVKRAGIFSSLMAQNLDNVEQLLKMQENVLGDTNILRIRLLARKAFYGPDFSQKVQDLKKVAAYIQKAFGETSDELCSIYQMLATLPHQERVIYGVKEKNLKQLLYGDKHYIHTEFF